MASTLTCTTCLGMKKLLHSANIPADLAVDPKSVEAVCAAFQLIVTAGSGFTAVVCPTCSGSGTITGP